MEKLGYCKDLINGTEMQGLVDKELSPIYPASRKSRTLPSMGCSWVDRSVGGEECMYSKD